MAHCHGSWLVRLSVWPSIHDTSPHFLPFTFAAPILLLPSPAPSLHSLSFTLSIITFFASFAFPPSTSRPLSIIPLNYFPSSITSSLLPVLIRYVPHLTQLWSHPSNIILLPHCPHFVTHTPHHSSLAPEAPTIPLFPASRAAPSSSLNLLYLPFIFGDRMDSLCGGAAVKQWIPEQDAARPRITTTASMLSQFA